MRLIGRIGLPPNVIALGVVSFLADVSSEMMAPILPLFLVGVLGASYAIVGLIEGSADSASSILRIVAGWYSDKFQKRKSFMVLGYAPTAFLKPLLFFAQNAMQVFAIRVPERLGKGIRTPARDALLSESVPKSILGRTFGFHRAMDTSGAVVGSALGLLLLMILMGSTSHVYRWIFVYSAIPAAVSVIIAVVFVKEKIRETLGAVQRNPFSFIQGLSSFNLELRFFFIVVALATLGAFNFAFYILKAKSVGFLDAQVLLLYVLFNIVYAAASMPAGILSDKIGRRNVILVGMIVFIGLAVGFATQNSPLMVMILFVVYGLFMALSDGMYRAYVAELAHPDFKATALGAYHTVTAAVLLPSSLIAGFLWDSFGSQAPFMFSAVIACIAFILFCMQPFILRRYQPGSI